MLLLPCILMPLSTRCYARCAAVPPRARMFCSRPVGCQVPQQRRWMGGSLPALGVRPTKQLLLN